MAPNNKKKNLIQGERHFWDDCLFRWIYPDLDCAKYCKKELTRYENEDILCFQTLLSSKILTISLQTPKKKRKIFMLLSHSVLYANGQWCTCDELKWTKVDEFDWKWIKTSAVLLADCPAMSFVIVYRQINIRNTNQLSWVINYSASCVSDAVIS